MQEIYFNYISNDEIGWSFLCDDGVHLLDNDIDVLAGNFLNNINSAIVKRIFNSSIWIDRRLCIRNGYSREN